MTNYIIAILKKSLPKILLLFGIGLGFYSCSLTKKVPESKQLLTKNIILVNDTIKKDEILESFFYQKPNGKFFGLPLRLTLYNMAKDNPDSLYYDWLNRKPDRRAHLAGFLSDKQVDRLSQSFIVSGFSKLLKNVGQAPSIIDDKKIKSTRNKLKAYYNYNLGYFDAEVETQVDTVGEKKGKVSYKITTGKQSILDTIDHQVETKDLEQLYIDIEKESLLKKGDPFNSQNFLNERSRITEYFRNHGVYHFQVNNIKYDIDTLNPNHRVNVNVRIEDRSIKKGDTLVKTPFKIYKISQVNIFTSNTSKKEIDQIQDSVSYKNFNIYSSGKLNYRPKALTDAIFIEKGRYFSDRQKTRTTQSISNLKVFNFPTIEYVEDSLDVDNNSLIANIYLVPKKKFNLNVSTDFSHSNIQDFGISGNLSLTFRNIFKGAEILELSGRGNIGSSRDMANPNNTFFNISEYGGDVKLSFPRIFFPVNTQNIIKKYMLPTTQFSVGFSNQRNIGLDKESVSGSLNYSWKTNFQRNSFKLELLGVNYVRNLNIGNYFNVYKTSYNSLNELAQIYNQDPSNIDPTTGNLTDEGAVRFMEQSLTGGLLSPQNPDFKTILSLSERYYRLIEDNLIVSSSFTFSRSTKNNLTDKNYYNFRTKLESAGNLLSLLANNFNNSGETSASGNQKVFGIEYAQYAKGEVEYIKQWDLGRKQSIAIRSFAGIAIPYGNGTSIPFSRSYFGGGSNDNRGWQAYSLGPGKSQSILDFNEANMKLAFSAEYRFNFFGSLDGALFSDVGNIWNVFDNIENTDYTFNGIKSLEDLAVGSGIGFRYDFKFFVFRIDLGYKAYDPSRELNDRWFKGFNFNKTVLNFGINYPF